MTSRSSHTHYTCVMLATILPLLVACVQQPVSLEQPVAVHPTEASGMLRAYVVRHAEKASDGDNPPLTEQGSARAEALRDLLTDQPIAAVYSTPYLRTTRTVQPTADAHGLEVTTYDPGGDLPADLIAQHTDQTVLIAGHSNTVPAIVGGLGAELPDEIPHERYGDLWLVTRTHDQVELEHGRFGD